MYEKIEITFKNGNKEVYGKSEWNDYCCDGSFFSIKKDGGTIAMYNADFVFCIRLI